MPRLHVLATVLFLVLSGQSVLADELLSAGSIMAQVAANQDRSEKLRSQYIYQQRIHVISRKTNGKLLREETADYHVIPQPNGTEKSLQHLTGRYWHDGKYVDFSGEPLPAADTTDGQLVHSFREDLADDHSKDGLGRDLFPLTTDQQKDLQFNLIGEETFEGHKAWHIGFSPKDKQDIDWAGEAFIDEKEFQPMYVFTKLSHRLPAGVRVVLGTDLPGIGFAVHYRRQEQASGFPPAWEANSAFAFCSSSIATCQSRWIAPPSSTRT